MEGEGVVDKSSSSPTGLPINWSLITGPVPEPVFMTSPLSSSFPLSQNLAVHSLQTKVKAFSQRRLRGRDKDKETIDPDVQESSLCGIGPEVYLRPKEREKTQVAATVPSWRFGTSRNLSTSDEDQEVEVQVKLEIHSPPAEAQMLTQGTQDVKENSSDKANSQVSLVQSKSLESLLSDNHCHGKNETLHPLEAPVPTSSTTIASSTFSISTRHWAPPKGFWRIARPETLLLNGVPSTLPIMDYTKIDEKWKKPEETTTKDDVGVAVDDADAPSGLKHSDSMECYLDKCEKEVEAQCASESWESTTSQSVLFPTNDKLRVKQKAYAKLRERLQSCKEENGQSGESAGQYEDTVDRKDTSGLFDGTDSAIPQELEPYLRSLLVINDELPLSPRHEQAKRLLERARLKARNNHIKGFRISRRSLSDQRDAISKKQQADTPSPTQVQKAVQTKEDSLSQTGPLLVPNQRDTSPSEQGGRTRRNGCSPTRVRFVDESEKEAETRYLDRVRQRGRPKNRESNIDSIKNQKGVSVPLSQNNLVSVETQTVVKEIIVLVKKCEACGSVVRETQSVTSPPDLQNTELQQTTNTEDSRSKQSSRHASVTKPETSTRPKAPLTVTFAGAYVLGENREISSGWKSSGFGKLRRRSRKGESRMESGHGPYGPSWAQRRNSNPRNRTNISRGVTFAPGSPVALEPRLIEASGGVKESTGPALPIKSALKSSSRNRSSPSQSTVQFQVSSSQGAEGGSQQESVEVRRESPVNQGGPGTSSPVSCIRPSTLRYSPARLIADLPAADLWDATPDGPGVDAGPGTECRPILRTLAVSRAEDLRAELLRAEHLKAEAIWEENSDGTRKLDGRPKLFLRRFFSSIGLNSVGRLVKGSRSSSMEQLSIPPAPRASSASPSPTRRPQPTIHIQRTPSLQMLHTVFPLAQLRKASSVQSLERKTERSTILGEVQIPYGLAPSPDSPQLELHRALSVENVLVSRMVRPVGRVTQAFSDGTLLLELIRPPNGPFGFVISRGKGRPDTGVYVEKVGDGSAEGLYMGLLGVGDEILQVNGEAVAGLSLDQVTRLMTRDSTASLRIMPARRSQR